MPDKEKSSRGTLASLGMGALVGALLGVVVSLVLVSFRSPDGSQRAQPGIGNYVRLGVAMFMLAKQASELIAAPSKQQA
jgi:hypothetical protein